jgi:hypothetical protein
MSDRTGSDADPRPRQRAAPEARPGMRSPSRGTAGRSSASCRSCSWSRWVWRCCSRRSSSRPSTSRPGRWSRRCRSATRVLVNKLVHRFRDIDRGEIVVFNGLDSFTPEIQVEEPTNPVAKGAQAIASGHRLRPAERARLHQARDRHPWGTGRLLRHAAADHRQRGSRSRRTAYLFPGNRAVRDAVDIEGPNDRNLRPRRPPGALLDSRAHLDIASGTVSGRQGDRTGVRDRVAGGPLQWTRGSADLRPWAAARRPRATSRRARGRRRRLGRLVAPATPAASAGRRRADSGRHRRQPAPAPASRPARCVAPPSHRGRARGPAARPRPRRGEVGPRADPSPRGPLGTA